MSRAEYVIAAIVCAIAAFFVFVVPVLPQVQHPPGFDPYAAARDQNNRPCCHGRDCGRWEGAEPVRVHQGGVVAGHMFGPHFLPDSRLMKPETLHVSERAFHQLCLRGTYTACGFVSAGF